MEQYVNNSAIPPSNTPSKTNTSTPTVPEFSTLMILLFFAAVILFSIAFVRKRIDKFVLMV